MVRIQWSIQCPRPPRSIYDTAQSYRETVSLWNSPGDHFVWFKLSTRFGQAPFHYPNVTVGFLFVQLERLWNSLYTATGTNHGLFHSLNIYANLNFGLFGAKNGPQIWPSRTYLLHTNKSSSNELISQVWGESGGNFSRKLTKTYLGPKRAQKFSPQEPFRTHTHLKVPIICL